MELSYILQHNRFVQECKDAEPDVLFVGDSMVQLMQQYEVIVISLMCVHNIRLQFHLFSKKTFYPNAYENNSNRSNAMYTKEKPTIGAPILSFHKYKSSRAEQCVCKMLKCA